MNYQDNTNELIKHYQKRGLKHNFHSNFFDLNPDYIKRHHERVKKVANNWIGRIEQNLHTKVEKESFKIFVDKVKKGKQLTVDELRQLDKNKKSAYIKIRLQMDDKVKTYLNGKA